MLVDVAVRLPVNRHNVVASPSDARAHWTLLAALLVEVNLDELLAVAGHVGSRCLARIPGSH